MKKINFLVLLVMCGSAFSWLSCTNSIDSVPVRVSVGQNADGPKPVISVSTNGGYTWTTQEKDITGFLTLVDCVDRGDQTLCVAVGQEGATTLSGPALVYMSDDNGATWKKVSYFEDAGNANAGYVSCTDQDTPVCAVVGQNGANNGFLAFTDDGGETWSQPAEDVIPFGASILHAVECFGEGSTATCIAVGNDFITSDRVLIVTRDRGETWKRITDFDDDEDSGDFQNVACTNSEQDRVCMAVGTVNDTQKGLIAISKDNGKTWKALSGVPKAIFSSGSCTGSGETAVCAVAGRKEDGAPATLGISQDGGDTWSFPTSIRDLTTEGSLSMVSCTGAGDAAVCFAGGIDFVSSEPLLVGTTDGGKTWEEKTLTGIDAGEVTFVICNENEDGTTTCMASGYVGGFGTGPALMAGSYNGGELWSPIVADFPELGMLISTTIAHE